ncbi:uncharacterized protein LOC109601363 isoform X2 [Aethina tumida]|uniref:uncharacterized protein LOC109601363 isoform X2 n=1 Tax=Aethina tumida TaxID=116153 RepID=UPI00214944F8|nr:uncharacterized protein LOC109601363 isoform X2 [Aethina tumida]
MDPPDNLLCPKIDINKRQKQERYEDKCWTEQYRGDSRKWVLKDVSVQDTVPVSTMKTSYIPPHVRSLMTDFKTSTGPKRNRLFEQFRNEAIEEVMAESDPPPPIEEYCSTYDDQFFKPGFEVDDEFYKKDVEPNHADDLSIMFPGNLCACGLHCSSSNLVR